MSTTNLTVPLYQFTSDSGSSALVALNALMLKRTKLAGIRTASSPKATGEVAKVAAGAPA